VAERPLTDLQRRVLLALLARDPNPMTGNELGLAVRAARVRRGGGTWSGYQGPAQRIIPVITSLRRRGLIWHVRRPDGLSGTADVLTEAGRAVARELRAEGRTDG
jgi:hypothetical protein